MKTRAAMDKQAKRSASSKAKAPVQEAEAPASILFASALDDAQKSKAAPAVEAARLISAPERIQEKIRALAPQFGFLGKALSWFQARAAAPSHLRLAETVSLGEKRFVAIIHVEGRKFLIGGGTAGVSLLTQLDETA
jgi:hypothetical protein